MKSSGRFFIRILTSDPPILLSKNIHAEVNKSCAQIEEEKKERWVNNHKDSNLRP